jgi:hypothetical protein
MGFMQFMTAQKYCGASFSAYSSKVSCYCKYCNKTSDFYTFPVKIKFNRPLFCNTLKNPSNATAEGECKLNSITIYLIYKYYLLEMINLSFYSEKCYSINNPKDVHDAYMGDAIDAGLIDYSFEEQEVSTWYDYIEDTKNLIGPESYKQCRATAQKYALVCAYKSCE